MKFIYLYILLILTSHHIYAQRADCDADLNCLGRAITFTVSSGKNAHYVDVLKTPSQEQITTALTVEMWVKPTRQDGKVQYLAGFWGPASDVNDVWVLYINPNDELIFEINGPNTNLQSADNTIAKTDVSSLYETWYHVAAIFDGSTQIAKLYINGSLAAQARNFQYPANRLRIPQNDELFMKIGNTNAFSNDENLNRTFLGQIDEIRIWSRTFNDSEIYCLKNQSLNWNINNLVLYYRCNEDVGSFTLCDATNNGNTGLGRSGANIQNSDRSIQRTIFIESLDSSIPIIDTLDCKSSKTYRFTVRDTSSCSKSVIIDMIGDYAEEYTITPNRINNMVKDSAYSFTVTVDAEFQGSIASQLRIYSTNRCRFINRVNMNLTRITELHYSNENILFDSLKANCIEKPYIDSTLIIINQTNQTTSPRTIRINSISNSLTNVFVLNHPALPYNILPGDTFEIDVRFISGPVTSSNFDEIVILSNDICSPEKKIPLYGKVNEVIRISLSGSGVRLDSIDFGTHCIDFPSSAAYFTWENLLDELIEVIDIEYPSDVQGNQRFFPVYLEPQTGYLPNYVRYIPSSPGQMNDSIVFVIKSGECTIRKPIYVEGYGLFADIRFEVDSVDFGDVIIGQQNTINIPVKNYSRETLRVSFYMKSSQAFVFTGQQVFDISPNATINIPLTFRPTQEIQYIDELCFFEVRCYESGCIPVKGRGVLERFTFTPEILRIENVIGCQEKNGSLGIRNNFSNAEVLSNFIFTNPSGRFTLVEPASLPSQATINSGETMYLEFNYAPNDVSTDRNDFAYIEYETADGEKWLIQIYGSSVSPKVSIDSPVNYGKLEVGEISERIIGIENISPFPVTIDTITVPNGFIILDDPLRYTNIELNSRDTIRITVSFEPTEIKRYTGQLQVKVKEPCISISNSSLEGEAEIIALEVPLNVLSYGFVLPCDCVEREIQLINRSKVFEMSIDSVFFSAIGVTNPNPEFFNWTSNYYEANSSILPYNIPPLKRDTLKVIYCPRSIQDPNILTHNIYLQINASGSAWNKEFRTFLTGKQALLYETNRNEVLFPPTRVDTDANPEFVELSFPNYLLNPYRETLIIDTIKFIPDERVFTAFDSEKYNMGLNSYPTTLDENENLTLQFGFRPRAVRDYQAKAEIQMRKVRSNGSCEYIDTTIYLFGSGFAPAFGLSFHFGSNHAKRDTFNLITCDSILIPIYSSRDFPAEIVDINFQLDYDTTKLEIFTSQSPYLNSPCKGYTPYIENEPNENGTNFLLKNFCFVDSVKPIVYVGFKSKTPYRDTLTIAIDTILFDTEEVILYHIIAATDEATLIIQQPELQIISNDNFLIIDFDSVRVLDCSERTFYVKNIGDVPISLFEILDLHSSYEVISYIPPETEYIDVGDTIAVTIRFCPRNTDVVGENFIFNSLSPCFITDTAAVIGKGFAPEFNPMFYINETFTIPDTLFATLGDTINIPIYLSQNFADTIFSIEYWLEPLDFEVNMQYNPRALKYLSTNYTINGLRNIDYTHGNLNFIFNDVEKLSMGLVAENKFLVTIPDFTMNEIKLNSQNYHTDSIMFFDIEPLETIFYMKTNGKLGLDSLSFDKKGGDIEIYPNPAEYYLSIKNYEGEYYIYDLLGRKIQEGISKGEPIPLNSIPQGVYVIKYAGRTEKLIIK